MRRSRSALLITVLAGALALAGCGGDDGGGGGSEATTAPAAPATPAPSAPAGAGTLTAADFAFSPAELTFPGGAEITFAFKNDDSAPHNFTLEGVDGVDEDVSPGAETQVSFPAPAPGDYKFHCSVHPSMTGTLTVS
jgi:plastocyanin